MSESNELKQPSFLIKKELKKPAFLKEKESKKLNDNNNEFSKLKKNIIDHLKWLNNNGLSSKIKKLEDVFDTLNTKNISAIQQYFDLIKESNDNDLISIYIDNILSVNIKHKKESDDTHEDTWEQNKRLSEKVETSIDELLSISIDGWSSKEVIISDINSYIDDLDLDNNVKEILREKLISIVENHEKTKEIWFKSIDNYFNEIWNNLEKRSDWKYQITINEWDKSETVIFNNKEEAINVLVSMKSKAELKFQSYLDTWIEAIANFYINSTIWLWELFIEDEIWAFESLKTNFENSDWWYFVGSMIVIWVYVPLKTVMIGSLFVTAHSWVTESIYRRVKDPFVNNSEKMQMKDYLRISTAMPELDTPEWKDYIEVKQRSLIIQLLKEKLETDFEKWTKEYKNFHKEIKAIEWFKLNRSPTFYYLANKVTNDSSLWFKSNFGKGLFYNMHSTFLKWAKLYYPKVKFQKSIKFVKWLELGEYKYEPYQKIARNILDNLEEGNMDKLNNGLKLFYSNKAISLDRSNREELKINISEWDDKKILYDKIISYIKSKDVSWTKQKVLINKFKEYISVLWKNPKGVDSIYRDLYILLETDYVNKGDLNNIIKEEIKLLEKEKFSLTKNTEKIVDKISFWKIQSKLRKLYFLQNLVESWEWIWDKNEIKADIKIIKSWWKTSENYSSKLKNIDFSLEFWKMKDLWKEFFEETSEIKKILFKNSNIDNFINLKELDNSFKTDDLLNIQNHLDYILDNKLEVKAENNINYLLKKFTSGEVLFKNLDDFYIEIDKILKGDLPKSFILDELWKVKIDKLPNDSKIQLKELQELVKNNFDSWESFSVDKNELKTITNHLKNWNKINFDTFKSSFNIIDLKANLSKNKDLHLYDFKDSLSDSSNLNKIEDSIKSKYSSEISYLKVLKNIENIDFDIERELDLLSKNIFNNNYTLWQVKIILEKLFEWNQFKNIDLDKIIKDTESHNSKFNIEQILKGTLSLEFDKLNDISKKETIDFIKNNSTIDNSILPVNIKEKLKLDSQSWDIKAQKSSLQDKIKRIENVRDSTELKELRKELTKYLDDNKIDRNSDDFKILVEDFNKKLNEKFDSFETKTSDTPIKTEVQPKLSEKEILWNEQKRLNKILKPLEVELRIRGKVKEANTINMLYKGINDPDFLKDFLDKNLDISKKRFENYYLEWEKIRAVSTLQTQLNKFKNIDFDSLNISDFNSKIKDTFKVDSSFEIKSVDDMKKVVKNIF